MIVQTDRPDLAVNRKPKPPPLHDAVIEPKSKSLPNNEAEPLIDGVSSESELDAFFLIPINPTDLRTSNQRMSTRPM